MSLNIIDISSHQASINLASIFAQNPINGVIVKSTQGTTYVNPYCDGWVQWLITNQKPWGFYHYLSGTNAVNEAKYWVEQTLNYWGHGIPCADFEAEIVSRGGIKYLQTFLETVYNETKVKPFIYCSLSVVQSHKKEFQTLAAAGYPLWLAQYASATDPQYGFNPTPWQSGSYAPFDKITMHQYTSLGRLNGYSSNLDFDLFYGDINDWNKFAAKEGSEPTPVPVPTPTPSENIERAIELLEVAITLLKNTL